MKRWLRLVRWRAVVASLVALLAGDWLLRTIQAEDPLGKILKLPGSPLLHGTLCLLVAGLMLAFTFNDLAQSLHPVRQLSQELAAKRPRAVLLLFVSPLRQVAPLPPAIVFPLTLRAEGREAALVGEPLADFDALRHLVPFRFEWEQLVRAVLPHAGRLRRVFLFGSPGDDGSYRLVGQCEAVLRAYLPSSVVFDYEQVDFASFDSVTLLLSERIATLVDAGIRTSEVAVDITGGYKTIAAAAAAMTIESDVTFQYVETDGDRRVLSYDVARILR